MQKGEGYAPTMRVSVLDRLGEKFIDTAHRVNLEHKTLGHPKGQSSRLLMSFHTLAKDVEQIREGLRTGYRFNATGQLIKGK